MQVNDRTREGRSRVKIYFQFREEFMWCWRGSVWVDKGEVRSGED